MNTESLSEMKRQAAVARWGNQTQSERFWSKVRKGDGCWEWQAGFTPSGYGQFNRNVHGKWHVIPASRFAWIEANGDTDLCVLHRCDNRKCVRLDHLFLGTRQENQADMAAKGRGRNAFSGKTHCVRGHEFSEDNTYRYHGHRACKACRRWRRAQGSK